jgi:hypothetical protein
MSFSAVWHDGAEEIFFLQFIQQHQSEKQLLT